jgi:regulatory protein
VKKPSKPLEYALKLLGQRPYSEKKLTEKLQSREVEQKEIERVVSKLKELRFIDDLEFAKDYIEGAQNVRCNGHRKIYWQLIKKGISKNLAKQAIEEAYSRDNEVQAVRKLLDKFSKNIPKDKKMYERLMRRLISRGYDYSLVKRELVDFIKATGLRREIPE